MATANMSAFPGASARRAPKRRSRAAKSSRSSTVASPGSSAFSTKFLRRREGHQKSEIGSRIRSHLILLLASGFIPPLPHRGDRFLWRIRRANFRRCLRIRWRRPRLESFVPEPLGRRRRAQVLCSGKSPRRPRRPCKPNRRHAPRHGTRPASICDFFVFSPSTTARLARASSRRRLINVVDSTVIASEARQSTARRKTRRSYERPMGPQDAAPGLLRRKGCSQ